MSIRPVTSKQKAAFNKLAVHPLQSWEWGEFRAETGNGVIRLGEYKGKKLVKVHQIITHEIPRSYFKIATLIRGPVPSKELLVYLKKLAKQQHFIFIKLEPFEAANNKAIKLLIDNGAVRGKTLFTPTSFWLDLTKSETELLKSFHPKTRYNIRLAEKRGVKVKLDNSDEAFEKYLQLTKETTKRQNFYAHTESYHRKMWAHLHQTPTTKHQPPIAYLLTATYNNEIITTWILFAWQNFLYYPYGASTDRYKNVMANNLMMWEAIKLGKKLKLKTFDLWGREEGKGFTKFKEGYNPKVVEFVGTWDIPTSPAYYPYRFTESLRWLYLKTKSSLGLSKPKF